MEPVVLRGTQRASIGSLGEALDTRPRAALLLDGGKRVPLAAGEERRGDKRERCKVHRSEVELLYLVRRRVLALGDALEAVGARLGWEPPRPYRRGGWWKKHSLARCAPWAQRVGDRWSTWPTRAVPWKSEQFGDGVVVLIVTLHN